MRYRECGCDGTGSVDVRGQGSVDVRYRECGWEGTGECGCEV